MSFFSWFPWGKPVLSVMAVLHQVYREKMLPVEHAHSFYLEPMLEAEFSLKPSVLLVGPYSAGKTTFIKHLVGREFPSFRIGPEPTTDKFTVFMNGTEDLETPGQVSVLDASMPFQGLAKFGTEFLDRFSVVRLRSETLDHLTFIDTPGVLSGNGGRGYKFPEVVQWLVDRVDKIILMFDVAKTEVSPELLETIDSIKGVHDKISIVLNKADSIPPDQVMRVYGALMWNLGKVVNTPEVPKVYMGSFWGKDLTNNTHRALFEQDHAEIYRALEDLPRHCVYRKTSDFIRRVRRLRAHAYLMDHLYSEVRNFWWPSQREAKQKELLDNLKGVYQAVVSKWTAKGRPLSLGDFPNAKFMANKLRQAQVDFGSLQELSHRHLGMLDEVDKAAGELWAMLQGQSRQATAAKVPQFKDL